VGQIYPLDNPLLRGPLRPEHAKPRLLGHWGTTPGLNVLYAHFNRVIKARDLDAIYIVGPGHGGPATGANAYLEGTYSEVYPDVAPSEDGLRRLFRQFSFPGGIGSHVTPETPGSIHEGGELGYALTHAYGASGSSGPMRRASSRLSAGVESPLGGLRGDRPGVDGRPPRNRRPPRAPVAG
jgi:xylulose-5-phosphate/fructose-6-phosphate phosphoketolase